MRICTSAHLRGRVSGLLSRGGAKQRLSDSRPAARRQADKEAAGASAGGDRKKEASEVSKDQRKDERSSSKADDDRLYAFVLAASRERGPLYFGLAARARGRG